MIKVNIQYGEFPNTTLQTKSFKDENAAIEWCRRNYKKIFSINDYRTFFQPISHFDVIHGLRGVAN